MFRGSTEVTPASANPASGNLAQPSTGSRRLRHNLVAVAALALFAVSGCHKKTAPPPSSADPQSINLGQSVVLNWRTSGATTASIDGIGNVPLNGTQTVSPSSSTNFHLTATGDGGTTDASVRVTVLVPTTPNTADNGGEMGSDAAFHSHVQDLFFDYDSYDLRPDAQSSIEAAANYLNQHPAIKILIAGYCDDRGSAEYNITLGENRADSAKKALAAAGVAPDRVRTISYGKEKQFCTEETESCWQQNRRDQFSIDR
jgi:peptidoglycan-associated lipoprotein